ncbi:MAG: glycosyltransferase family 2 protein [Solirubrobacteraceae bacterium]
MPADALLSIDVVVVAFNRSSLTESCVAHLNSQTHPHRLILCDSGSTDGTAQRVRALRPDTEIVRSETNRPFSVNCNAGAAAGDGEVIVLINNDLDCRPDFLERLVTPLRADPAIGSVAALCIRTDGEHIDSIGLTTDVTLSGFPRLQGHPIADAVSARPVLTGPSGTAAAYRRSAWEQVGGLDQNFFAYHEDLDMALRLRAAGWGAAAAPDAVGMHVGSASHGHRSASQRRHGGFGRGYVLRRYGLLSSRSAARSVVTEGLVVIGDGLISRDLAALRGRIAGWRAARGLSARARPPEEAVDRTLTLRDTISLRRQSYSGERR